jgi:hypothetical protein
MLIQRAETYADGFRTDGACFQFSWCFGGHGTVWEVIAYEMDPTKGYGKGFPACGTSRRESHEEAVRIAVRNLRRKIATYYCRVNRKRKVNEQEAFRRAFSTTPR